MKVLPDDPKRDYHPTIGSISAVSRVRFLSLPGGDECGLVFHRHGNDLGDGVGIVWKTLPTSGKIPASPQVSSSLRSWPPFLCLCSPKNKQTSKLSRTSLTPGSSGRPRSKYNIDIRNIKICMVKKPIVFVTYGNKKISIKNSVSSLCVVLGPIYGRFMGCTVNGITTHKTAINRPMDHTRET